MKKPTWTLFGNGDFFSDILDAVESRQEIITHIILNQKIEKNWLAIIPKVILIEKIESFKPQTTHYFFGFINPNKKPILDLLKNKKVTFSNLIHANAYISSSTQLGQGNFIGAGSVVGPKTMLNNFNVLKRLSSIGHDCKVGNNNHIAPGVTIAGRCKIGNNNFFGAGSTTIDGMTVGDEITVGAGGVVVNDLTKSGVYVGVPARKLQK